MSDCCYRLSLQALVRKTGSRRTADQQRDITLRRARLQDRIGTFQKQAANFIHAVSDGEDDDSWEDDSAREVYVGIEFDGINEEDDEDCAPSTSGHTQAQLSEIGSTNSSLDAEHILLHLPSHIGNGWCNSNSAEDLAKAELVLRQGQLNDSLQDIRIALGYKAYLFRNDVRPARSQSLKTRAWLEVHAAESTVQHHARVYMHARQAIVDLGASNSLLDRYKVLTRQDLKIHTSIIAPQVHGQQNKSLPWFWTMDVKKDADLGEWLEDCECISILTQSRYLIFIQFIEYTGCGQKHKRCGGSKNFNLSKLRWNLLSGFLGIKSDFGKESWSLLRLCHSRGMLHGQKDKVQCGVCWLCRQSPYLMLC